MTRHFESGDEKEAAKAEYIKALKASGKITFETVLSEVRMATMNGGGSSGAVQTVPPLHPCTECSHLYSSPNMCVELPLLLTLDSTLVWHVCAGDADNPVPHGACRGGVEVVSIDTSVDGVDSVERVSRVCRECVEKVSRVSSRGSKKNAARA